MITPVDLETIVFRRGFRGYSTREVQEFMAMISHDYEHIYRENIDLKEKIEELTQKLSQYQVIEDTLRNAMVLAQETAEEVKSSAHQQAGLVLSEAKLQGEQIITKVKEDIQTELHTLAGLRNQVEFFKCQFKNLLNGLTHLVDHQLDIQMAWNDTLKANVSEKSQILKQEEDKNSLI